MPRTAAGSGNRRLETVYEFRTTNQNIAGGLIHNRGDEDTGLCMDAGTGLAGAKLQVKTCDENSSKQMWSYTQKLLLQLAGTSLCLQSDFKSSAQDIVLTACNVSERLQKWSFDDNGKFQGSNTNGTLNGYCFTVQNDKVNGSAVRVENGCGSGYDTKHTFSPEPKVGAGAAGEYTQQLVNYKMFGRCLDVTNQDVNYAWLIGYGCKQAPDPNQITWNQRFQYDTSQRQYFTNSPSGKRCLQAGTTSGPAVAGTRVLTKTCVNGDVSQKWTNTKDTGVYATSYNVVNVNGLCLTLRPDGPYGSLQLPEAVGLRGHRPL